MANPVRVDAKAISTTKSHDPLQTKYLCQVTRKQIVDVVAELSAVEETMTRRLPLRYVLVVDVSGSMDSIVGKESESLLDRVKIFAEMVIHNLAERDSLAIVTFSHDVEVDMDMTLMNKDAKVKCFLSRIFWKLVFSIFQIVAKGVVERLHTRGTTNLEIGLLAALDVLKRNPSENNRDMIIVFTDGMANEGETDPEALVKKYKDSQATMIKSSCVPLSALTIGQYVPVLLDQLADYLGSEAFYWLNEEEEFEADMLIPVFLRETTRVTDVNIVMTCLEGVTFSSEDVPQKHILESSNETLKYFIHSIPLDVKKHIPLVLVFPQDRLKELDGQRILDITVTYLDGKMSEQRINDFVELITVPLSQVQQSDKRGKGGMMDEVSAFSMSNNSVDASWNAAQASLRMVASEKCRTFSTIAINNAMYHISQADLASNRKAMGDAILEINKIKKNYTTLLGMSGEHVKQLTVEANKWIAKLNFGKTIKNEESLGRLFAMKSSIDTEMPTARGVFDPKLKQPYLPPRVEKKLRQYEKIVKKTKKEKKTFQATRVFKAQNILVSESLRDKKVGSRQETFSELIIQCGGRPVPNVNTVFNDTFLVCSEFDYKKNTVLVRDSKRAKIPIVREQFIYDCIREKRIVELENYLINPSSTQIPVSN